MTQKIFQTVAALVFFVLVSGTPAETTKDGAAILIDVRPVGEATKLGEAPDQKPLPPLLRQPTLKRRDMSVTRQLRKRSRSGREEGAKRDTRTLLKRVTAERYRFELDQETVDLGARGPSSTAIELAGQMRVDVNLRRNEILNVFPLVYQDQNPASGVFYYLPQAYRLAWHADQGFGIRFLYTAGVTGETGDVQLTLRLDAGIGLEDTMLARRLLEDQAQRLGLGKVQKLVPLPLMSAPEVSLAADLERIYEIDPGDVSVHAFSDSLGEINVSVATDPVTKENLQLVLEQEVGLHGRVVLTPYGDQLASQEIPLTVRLADRDTFGHVEWKRGVPWRNQIPYPVELRYLHALIVDHGTPTIYSWELLGSQIPSGGKAEIPGDELPDWLDETAARIWLDYRVNQGCEECDREVMATITGGVSAVDAREISFRTLSPLADMEMKEIILSVRSRYFHPTDRTETEKSAVVLKSDDHVYELGPIFVDSRGDGSDPFFRYRLQVVRPDGHVMSGPGWISSRELYVPIGSKQVTQALTGEDP